MRIETSSISTLSEMHRIGHTCANLYGDSLIIWGGVNKRVAYLTSPNPYLWIYDTSTGLFKSTICTGECPPYLCGATSSLIGEKMYIFGGQSIANNDWTNSMYCLDLDTCVWQDLGSHARAEPSKPICSDKGTSWSFNGRLFMFGGYGNLHIEHFSQLLDKQQDLQIVPDQRCPQYGWNNQLVEFNPNNNTWYWPTYSGKAPSARAAHSGALIGSEYYIFGGRGRQGRMNDLYILNMNTLQWNSVMTIANMKH